MKPIPKPADAADPNESKTDKAAAERFKQDLLTRGEAVEPEADGTLSKEATHAIVKENPDGSVEVKRARFKLW